jgi:hypothetical protein
MAWRGREADKPPDCHWALVVHGDLVGPSTTPGRPDWITLHGFLNRGGTQILGVPPMRRFLQCWLSLSRGTDACHWLWRSRLSAPCCFFVDNVSVAAAGWNFQNDGRVLPQFS